MSEEDKSQSMSDKDRTMANRFGSEANEDAPEKDDEDDEKDEKKDEKRPPKRALFLPSEKEESVDSTKKAEEEKPKRNLFSGFLRTESKSEEKQEQPQDNAESDVSGVARESEVEVPQDITPEVSLETNEAEQEVEREEFQEVVLDRIGEVEAELEEMPAEEEATEALASAAFLEQVGERLEEGLSPAEAIDDALEDELEPPEADAMPEDLENMQNFDAETIEEDDEQTVTPTIPTRPASPPRPPSPPLTRVVPPYMPPPRGPSSFNANLPSGGAISPNAVQKNPDIEQMNDYYYRKRRSGDLLLGGVVGYLLGKRRGRRATEAKFEPELRKRDDAIGDLKDKLINSEEKVRALASAKSAEAASFDSAKPKTEIVEKTTPIIETRTEYVEVPTVETVTEKIESLPVETIESERQTLVEQEKVFLDSIEVPVVEVSEPEKLSELLTRSEVVEQLQAVAEKAEKVIVEKVIIENRIEAAEKAVEVPQLVYERAAEKPKPSSEKLSNPPSTEIKKDPRTMTMPELLGIADHIFLEKTSVRELYEHNRIDAVNLRRVVLEYMNGGTRYEKVLHRSLEAVEMQRELRNEIRHDPAATFSATGAQGDAKAAEDNLLESVKQSVSQRDMYENTGLERTNRSEAKASEEQLMLSNGTAIVVGVLMGIAIMIVLFLYAR
jgi:hypothetical protein